jgi:cytochrome c553
MSKRYAAAVCAAIGLLAGGLRAPAVAADAAAQAQACDACHGGDGLPISATIPIIWGQQSSYLYKELHDFHSGDRKSPIMAPLVHDISLDDLRTLANYFAAKAWPTSNTAPAGRVAGPSSGDATPPPAEIADKIEMCKACHQPNFTGGDPGPRLAGLSAEYLASQMHAFADGTRTNNLDMPGFMRALTVSDREAIAKYLSGL